MDADGSSFSVSRTYRSPVEAPITVLEVGVTIRIFGYFQISLMQDTWAADGSSFSVSHVSVTGPAATNYGSRDGSDDSDIWDFRICFSLTQLTVPSFTFGTNPISTQDCECVKGR